MSVRKDKTLELNRSITPIRSYVPPGTPLASVLPDLDNLQAVNEFISQDPSNLVSVLPGICSKLHEACISDPQYCPIVWKGMFQILKDLSNETPRHKLKPPLCKVKPYEYINCHGEEWSDDYAWLNDKSNSEVLEYIKRENDYTDKYMESSKGLQKLLFKEFVERLHEDEESARVLLSDGWVYYSKYVFFSKF
jgi:oligopeptidase B